VKDVLKYKEFIGSVHFNMEDMVFYGKIEGINDLITFEGKSVDELVMAFQESVEDYITICREHQKEQFKSCKGSFNIRISPELHRKVLERSIIAGISINQFIQRTLKKEIELPH